jgi:hypothetical protein
MFESRDLDSYGLVTYLGEDFGIAEEGAFNRLVGKSCLVLNCHWE